MSSPASSVPCRQARLDKVQRMELRHKIELHNLTGRVIECPLGEMNRPRASVSGCSCACRPLRRRSSSCSPGGVKELSRCRKFAPAARNYAAARHCHAARNKHESTPSTENGQAVTSHPL